MAKEIYVEFVILGNSLKATAILPEFGLEATVIGPANAAQSTMAHGRPLQAGIHGRQEKELISSLPSQPGEDLIVGNRLCQVLERARKVRV